MKVLVKTNKMPREEWLKWRKMGIGGSDASIIAGVNKFRSIYQLWAEKTGQTEPEETESEYAHFGTVLEPVVKKEFTNRTGLKVRSKRAILQSEEHPFMLANLDGIIREDGKLCIFEAKTASAHRKEEWERGVPLEYLYQVQHYMAVTGAEKTYIAALIGGNHFLYHEIYRDEGMIQNIIRMEKSFWETNVLLGIEPFADGSSATTKFLDEKYQSSNGNTILLPDEVLPLCKMYDNISTQMNELKQKKEEITNQMKTYLGENEKGIVGDRQISWKPVISTTLDKKRLEKENKEIYDEYCVKNQYRRLSVA